MRCEDNEERGLPLDYVARHLDDDVVAAFEEHYLVCSRCFALVQAAEVVRHEIRSIPLVGNRWRSWAVPLGIAASSILAIGLLLKRPVPGSSSSLAPAPTAVVTTTATLRTSAGVFDPPAWPALTYRGASPSQDLTRAWSAYMAHDYARSKMLLSALVSQGDRRPAVLFFLGVSKLQLKDWRSGLEDLQAVRKMGETPFLEETYFYAAHGYLGLGESAPALEELTSLVRLNGDFKSRAEALANEIRSTPER